MEGQNPFEELNERLKRIEQKLEKLESEKEESKGDLLTIDELASYTGLSRSYLHKLSSQGVIAGYKPFGKKLYFDRQEVDQWMKQNRSTTSEEIDQRASDIMNSKGGGE